MQGASVPAFLAIQLEMAMQDGVTYSGLYIT